MGICCEAGALFNQPPSETQVSRLLNTSALWVFLIILSNYFVFMKTVIVIKRKIVSLRQSLPDCHEHRLQQGASRSARATG